MIFPITSLVIFCSVFNPILSSVGDRSLTYVDCVRACRVEHCSEDGVLFKLPKRVSLFIRLFWTCTADCEYHCMWYTVEMFKTRGLPYPQFHGKWPFLRILGIQEPASVFFSLLNLYVTVNMIRQYRQKVRSDCPTYKLWWFYALICCNTWVCSAIFHFRDVTVTEIMDYISASAVVFFFIFCMGMRFLLPFPKIYSIVFGIICVYFFLAHAFYIAFEDFDYGYNMTTNVSLGGVGILVSLVWSVANYKTIPHVKYLATQLVLSILTTSFELLDFPPIFWAVDAHALWHLSTVPLPYFFWKFVIEDCRYLSKRSLI